MTKNDEQQAYYELVFVMRNNEIVEELFHTEFQNILNNSSQMAQFAAEKVQCVYAAVSSRLALRGAVCFALQFDEHGVVDSGFSLPLRHLLETAGAGPDFGTGAIKLACRSQCSISWQAKNLWEPSSEDTEHPLNKVQRCLWRNRLGLIITDDPLNEGAYFSSGFDRLDLEESGSKLDKAFGEEGRISLQELIRQHSAQIETLKSGFRDNFDKQQQEHLFQVKKSREALQQLKVELRMEQQRSLRLQQLLRGESRL